LNLEKGLETLRRTPSPTFATQEEKRRVRLFRESLSAEAENRKIPRTGEELPFFRLFDPSGNEVPSTDLLKKGPLALFFFRGSW
jgi:hypothetical protein